MKRWLGAGLWLFLCLMSVLAKTPSVPAPESVLGFTPGDDRKLASWAQVIEYFQKLDAASERVKFQEIGKTTLGAPFVYAAISTPENLAKLDYYKDIQRQLADPRTFRSNDAQAKKLIAQGKTIVLITCGIHSTEVGSYLSSMLIAHRLAASDEPEIKKILAETIILLVPSLNPDGVDIVKNWYDKTLGTPYEGTDPPQLYHHYVGHDNNRDWYAFTQVETQLTVDHLHNAWHPQIVHDIHQQGALGSRLFLPPYMQPVEPNVPQKIVEGYTQLGQYMTQQLRAQGFQGITYNSTYDAWTPARAYAHYHGGVRILSETASARIASPRTVKFEDLRAGDDDGYNPQKESANFGPLWPGGEWRLRNITDTMTAAAFHLLNHAANNREKWLTRFYQVGKEAVRPRRGGELYGFRLPVKDQFPQLLSLLKRAGVEYEFPRGEKNTTAKYSIYAAASDTYPAQSVIIPLAQPYGAFAKAMLENQIYPNLKDATGHPQAPYDVTAHTLALLFDVKAEKLKAPFPANWIKNPKVESIASLHGCPAEKHIGLYRSSLPVMDEGWTRWVLDKQGHCPSYNIINDRQIRANNFTSEAGPDVLGRKAPDTKFSVILFPDQSANGILKGHAPGRMPDELTGGIGTEGVAKLREFVENGGTLVFLNRASDFAIEQFKLPLRDITTNWPESEFYCPGSILRTELDTKQPLAQGMPRESIAWFEDSPVFEVETGASNVRVVARYPANKNPLLSGWLLGGDRIRGKAALVEVTMGKGRMILFGFRPQYRGQSLATFPLLFNALRGK